MAYVINLDKYPDIGMHWIALYYKRGKVVYFNSFGVEHVPEESKEFIGHENIEANIFSSTSKQFSKMWILLHWIH